MKKQIYRWGVLLAMLLAANAANAQQFLKQSTASQAVKLCGFVDSTDGNTEASGLTIANTDIKISKAGGAFGSKNSGGATYDAVGCYTATLDATDTNTVGRLDIAVHPSGALAVYARFQIVEEAIYDGLYGASAGTSTTILPVNTAQVGGTSQTGRDLGASVLLAGDFTSTMKTSIGTAVAASAVASVTAGVSVASGGITNASFACSGGSFPILGITDCGTAQSASGSTLVMRSGATFANDEVIGQTVLIGSATTGSGQAATISDNVGSSDTLSVTWPATTPTGTIPYYVFGTAAASGGGGSGLDAAGVRAAIGLTTNNLDTQLSAIDDYIDTEVGAIKTKTDFLPSATPGSSGGLFIAGTNAATTITTALTTNLAGSVNSIGSGGITSSSFAADAISAAKLASDVTTELQTGLATSAALTTLSNTIGTPSNLGSGATVAANLSDIESQTDDIGTAGAGLTAVPWNSAWNTSLRGALGLSSANLDTQLSGIPAAVWAITMSEPTGKPTWGSSTMKKLFEWQAAWSINKITQTSTTKTLRNTGDSGNIATCTVSDNGTTFTQSACSP